MGNITLISWTSFTYLFADSRQSGKYESTDSFFIFKNQNVMLWLCKMLVKKFVKKLVSTAELIFRKMKIEKFVLLK